MQPDLRNTASWEALHKRTGRLDDRGLNHSKFTTPLYQRIQLRTDNLGQNLEKNTEIKVNGQPNVRTIYTHLYFDH